MFVTKKLLEKQNLASVDQFMNDYFAPEIENSNTVKEFVKKYVSIDKIGIFFPVFIQELTSLGNKVFLDKEDPEIIKEIKLLVAFLEKFSQREIGDVTIPNEFFGNYTRCAIKIIAIKEKRETGQTTSYIEKVSDTISKGFENIYVIGSARTDNKDFIDSVIKSCCEKNKQIEIIKNWDFKGAIILRGETMNVRTYLVHLRNPSIVKHIIEKSR